MVPRWKLLLWLLAVRMHMTDFKEEYKKDPPAPLFSGPVREQFFGCLLPAADKMRTLSILLVVLCGIAYAHAGFLDFLGGGGGGGSSAPEGTECNWKKKERGAIAGAMDTVGGAVGTVLGGLFGAVVPTAANKAGIQAAGGGKADKGTGSIFDSIVAVPGGAWGGMWGALVPNSARCASIDAAKTMGNVDTDKRDPACENYHWVDENGNTCTPTKAEKAKDGHTDNDFDTIVHTVNMNIDDKAEAERVVNALVARWKKILAKYGVQGKDVGIVIYDDQASDSTHTVKYTIKFKKPRNKKYSLDAITREFQNNLESDPIDNVSVASE